MESLVVRNIPDRSGHAVLATLGTLGAGKTTFIDGCLPAFRSAFDRVVVIENDVGKQNVDAQVLATKADEIRALTAGCLCCADVQALRYELELLKSRPITEGRIGVLLEPTGLADPKTISEVLRDSGLPYRIITLLDVAGFRFNYSEGRLADHIEVADLVLCTHWGQLTRSADDQLRIAEVVNYITPRLQRDAEFTFITKDGLKATLELPDSAALELPAISNAPRVAKGTVHGLFPQTIVFKEAPTLAQLEQLVSVAAGYGTPVVRLKGYASGQLVQYSGHGEINIERQTDAPPLDFLNLFSAAGKLPRAALDTVFGDTLMDNSKPVQALSSPDLLAVKLSRLRQATSRFAEPLVVNSFGETALVVDYESDDAIAYAFNPEFPKSDTAAYSLRSLSVRLAAYDLLHSGQFLNHPSLPYYMTRVGNHLKWLIDDALPLIPDSDAHDLADLQRRCNVAYPATMYFDGLASTTKPEHIQALKEPGLRWMISMTNRLIAETGNANEAVTLARTAFQHCMGLDCSGTWRTFETAFSAKLDQIS